MVDICRGLLVPFEPLWVAGSGLVRSLAQHRMTATTGDGGDDLGAERNVVDGSRFLIVEGASTHLVAEGQLGGEVRPAVGQERVEVPVEWQGSCDLEVLGALRWAERTLRGRRWGGPVPVVSAR